MSANTNSTSTTTQSDLDVPVRLTTPSNPPPKSDGPTDTLRAQDFGTPVTALLAFFDKDSIPAGETATTEIRPEGQRRNWGPTNRHVEIKDMRKLMKEKGTEYVHLDKSGWDFCEIKELGGLAKGQDDQKWGDGWWIRDVYFPVIAKHLAERFDIDPSKVLLLNAYFRNHIQTDVTYHTYCKEGEFYGPSIQKVDQKNCNGIPLIAAGFNDLAHTDGFELFYQKMVKEHAPNGERFRCLGVWKPINNDVWDVPLAVIDRHDRKKEHYARYDMVFQSRFEGTELIEGYASPSYAMQPAVAEECNWYSVSHQKPTEPLFFTHFDTNDIPSGIQGVGHAAFRDPRYFRKSGFPTRESVELRVMVVGGK